MPHERYDGLKRMDHESVMAWKVVAHESCNESKMMAHESCDDTNLMVHEICDGTRMVATESCESTKVMFYKSYDRKVKAREINGGLYVMAHEWCDSSKSDDSRKLWWVVSDCSRNFWLCTKTKIFQSLQALMSYIQKISLRLTFY